MNLREWARATHRVLSEQREEGGAALSGDVVKLVLWAAVSTLVDALAAGDELRIDALGRLWIEEKAARRTARPALMELTEAARRHPCSE